MPIQDWTRTDAGAYHDFHQDWTIEIRRALNRGILPADFMALADLKVGITEPDVSTLKLREPPMPGGLAVTAAPPHISRAEMDDEFYARKANRIIIKHRKGHLVVVIEVVSPGNKNNKNGLAAFVSKMVDYLRNGINVVVIDIFLPGPRDPEGIHALISDEFGNLAFEPRPTDKPLTIASIDAGERVAYVDPVGIGDPLPDAPLFLSPGWYVNVPLERTYMASWAETPQQIRYEVAPEQSANL